MKARKKNTARNQGRIMNTCSKLLSMGGLCALMAWGGASWAEEKSQLGPGAELDVGAEMGDAEDMPVKMKPLKRKSKAQRKEEGVWKFKLDEVRATVGGFTDNPAPDLAGEFFALASARMQTGNWEFALGARLDAQAQDGPDFSRVRLDYAENYLRWRDKERSLTLGTQNVLWGRVDEISPIDRVSRVDLTRLVLDKQPERRRAVPAIRLEQFIDDLKLDAVWLPVFDGAVMPHDRSAWHPVDLAGGRLLGIGATPVPLTGFRVRDDEHGSGGAGVRLTRAGGDIDYGLSVQRVRQSTPYYRLGPGVLTGVHPYSWVVGGELETQKTGATWRMELAWSSDVPVTRDTTFALDSASALDMVIGAEFFPGDAETRVTLQLAGHRKNTPGQILDRGEIYAMTGEVEHPFAQGRWRFNLRFASGLNDRDVYFNPRLTFLGVDQHEFFLAAHVFSGEEKTLGGYYKDKDLIELGWRAKF
jgi:hypothetical protein